MVDCYAPNYAARQGSAYFHNVRRYARAKWGIAIPQVVILDFSCIHPRIPCAAIRPSGLRSHNIETRIIALFSFLVHSQECQ
ncbi:hypothetical protein BGY98DRAFT_984959 [Russula aff. rugulosa BPL654]|nr:hypothetical protein BGY98DRAFT_984959 [Russula aff. rugulosa BPL654]